MLAGAARRERRRVYQSRLNLKCPIRRLGDDWWRRLVAAPSYALSMQFTAAITHEGDWLVARCLEFEVSSQGDSIDGALENLKEALELYFEDQVELISFENPVLTTFQLSA
jgi:predicted RNase H-like HicB family nuclease